MNIVENMNIIYVPSKANLLYLFNLTLLNDSVIY